MQADTFSYDDYIRIVNHMLLEYNIDKSKQIEYLTDCSPSMFVIMFEHMHHERIPEIIRNPQSTYDHMHNMETLLQHMQAAGGNDPLLANMFAYKIYSEKHIPSICSLIQWFYKQYQSALKENAITDSKSNVVSSIEQPLPQQMSETDAVLVSTSSLFHNLEQHQEQGTNDFAIKNNMAQTCDVPHSIRTKAFDATAVPIPKHKDDVLQQLLLDFLHKKQSAMSVSMKNSPRDQLDRTSDIFEPVQILPSTREDSAGASSASQKKKQYNVAAYNKLLKWKQDAIKYEAWKSEQERWIQSNMAARKHKQEQMLKQHYKKLMQQEKEQCIFEQAEHNKFVQDVAASKRKQVESMDNYYKSQIELLREMTSEQQRDREMSEKAIKWEHMKQVREATEQRWRKLNLAQQRALSQQDKADHLFMQRLSSTLMR